MLKDTVVYGIRLYQKYISPFMGKTCRFYPSCSQYSIQSLQKYGFFKGSWFSARRLLRCHPYHPGGFDPVE